MFSVTSNVLGTPQIVVQQTQADWKKFLGQDSTAPSVPLMKPGFTIEAFDGVFGLSTFVLAFGVASLAIGDVVTIGAGYATTRLTAAARGIVAVSMSANTDPTALSWFCIAGQVPAKAATVAVNLPLYECATTGSFSSTVVATNQCTGAVSVLAASGTVTTKTVQTLNGSNLLQVPDLDGLYVGQAVSGTGIAGGSTIAAIGAGGSMLGAQGPSRNYVQLSANMTATAGVTGTFAHPATFCTAFLARPVASGLG